MKFVPFLFLRFFLDETEKIRYDEEKEKKGDRL